MAHGTSPYDVANLGIALPALPTGWVYHLLSVGGVRQHESEREQHEVQIYLQARPTTTVEEYSSAPVLQPYVDMKCASVLQAGSAWTSTGHRAPDFDFPFPEQHVIGLGCLSPKLVLATEAFADDELLDLIHITGRSSMWLAVWEWDDIQWVVPCFELLRSLFYCAGSRLTNFYFSRLPLTWLGRLIATPSYENDYGVHLCVTAHSLSPTEAQIIAALFCDLAYSAIIRRAHIGLAQQWMSGQSTALFRTDLRLDRNAYFHAQGFTFTWGGRPAFWVGNLHPKPQLFAFRQILYHPLQRSSKQLNSLYLAGQKFTDSLAEFAPCGVKRSNIGTTGFRAISYTGGLFAPTVKRGFPWAMVENSPTVSRYLDDQSALPWEVSSNCNTSDQPVAKVFTLLENQFKQHGRQVRRLSINNSSGQYGQGWSICLYGGHMPLLGAIYSKHLLRFAITEITYQTGYFYLIYSGQQNTCMLARFADMHQMSSIEQQDLLKLLASEINQRPKGHLKLHPLAWSGMRSLFIDNVGLTNNIKPVHLLCEKLLTNSLGSRTRRMR